jgi:hypothetical protein
MASQLSPSPTGDVDIKEKGKEDTTEVPGPLIDWECKFANQSTPSADQWVLKQFPTILYPPVRLETDLTPGEIWGSSHKGYPHVEDLYFLTTRNDGTQGNCYFAASKATLF